MSNLLDFERFSTFVGAVVDRKVKAVSMSVTSSTGFLKSLTSQAAASASASLNSAQAAQASASAANDTAASILSTYQNFTSTYGGIQPSDPATTILNGAFNASAFYVRKSDGRLRFASNVVNGVVTWADATVAADPASVAAAVDGSFLKLAQGTNQTVSGPVDFEGITLVPSVTAWTSQQATPASDVNNLYSSLQQALSNETTRAVNRENNIQAGVDANTRAVAAETSRALAAEANLSAVDTTINTRVDNLFNQRNIDIANLNGAIASVQQNLNNEVGRAQGAENNLAGQISSLSGYATAIDNDRKAQEGRLDGRINQEQVDRGNGDNAVQGNLNNEINRAINTENYLSGRIDGKLDASALSNLGGDRINFDFPSGAIVKMRHVAQGLSEGANYIYFDQAFPNRLLGVVAITQKINASGNILSYWEHDISTAQYFVFVIQDTEGSSGANGVTYIAWGD
jgi:hypothetical protein